MASLSATPLSTRGLVLALRRIPKRHPRVNVTLAYCETVPKLSVRQQYRSFFWRSKPNDKGDDDSAEHKDSETNRASSSRDSVGADSQEDAIVRVSSSELRRDTAPPFEPRLLALPVGGRPLFPGQRQVLQVTHEKVIQDLTKKFENKSSPLFVGTFLTKDETLTEDFSGKDPFTSLYAIGTRARIVQAAPLTQPGTQGIQLLLHGHDLIRMEKLLDMGPPLQLQVARMQFPDSTKHGNAADELKAYSNEIMHTMREIMKINPQFREQAALLHQGMQQFQRDDAHSLAHFAAQLTTATGTELMQVLEAEQPSEKLQLVLTLVKKELEVSKVQQKISTQIEEKMQSHQRQFMLREQMHYIKKELGEDKSDGSDVLLEKFRKRLESKEVPASVQETIDSELEKFAGLAKESQEFQITRNYLDWLTVLPWGIRSEDTLNLSKARTILDQDHYGLADVKERILELIAVGNLRGSVQGKIICFVGPPGVGKTSIGKSIAQALGREFYRFSVGGLHDVSEIKGHRRTYVGAMPGKVVQCLKNTQSANPLVLIDEVDKIGRGHQGDPASALLELLDSSQNEAFLDHYLDVPVDVSKVLFVCTANVTDTIPGPLLDRMEVIRLSGYDLQEKMRIAEDYLVPSAMREMGLWLPASTQKDAASIDQAEANADQAPENGLDESTSNQGAGGEESQSAMIEPRAIEDLIRWYCREAGVRNLQKHIEKICRKLAMKVVECREKSEAHEKDLDECSGIASDSSPTSPDLSVTADSLVDLVGKPPFTSDRLYEGQLPIGTTTGLAWTALGGSVLYLEAIALPRHEGKPASPFLSVTGQLGSVMKESSQLALIIARRHIAQLGLLDRRTFFEEHDIHLHCPEGATPKDGPSAGVTMVTSLLSLGLNIAVRADLAMTGEVSLNGKVLPIGGVKEKTIAARRAGCKALIFPKANRRDFDELPDYLKEDLECHFVSDYGDIFSIAFPDFCSTLATEGSDGS